MEVDLTAEEMEKIKQVMEKELEVIEQNENHIRDLKHKLEEIKFKSLSLNEESQRPKACFRCGVEYTQIYSIFVRFKFCNICHKKVCKKCYIVENKNDFICVYCETLRQIKGISGTWFVSEDILKESPREVVLRTIEKAKQSPDINIPNTLKKVPSKSHKRRNMFNSDSDSFDSITKEASNIQHGHKISSLMNLNYDTKISPTASMASTKDDENQKTDIKNDKVQIEVEEANNIQQSILFISKSADTFTDGILKQSKELSQPSLPHSSLRLDENIPHISVIAASSENMVTSQQTMISINTNRSTSDIKNIKTISKSGSFTTSESNQPSNVSITNESNQMDANHTDSFTSNGYLHGMICCEKHGSSGILKLKIIEGIDIKPMGSSNSVSSYVVCKVLNRDSVVFKKKTSIVNECSAPFWGETFEFVIPLADIEHIVIFLIISKPETISSIKRIIKKSEMIGTTYGSVRIGSANYLSDKEIEVHKKLLQYSKNGISDWVDFKIELNRVVATSFSNVSLQNETSVLTDHSDIRISRNTSSGDYSNRDSIAVNEETTSYFSISSHFYGDRTIIGSISMFIKYSSSKNLLTATVLRGDGLFTPAKPSSNAKVHAKCKLIPKFDENNKKCTISSKNITQPDWNSTFIFKLNPTDLSDEFLLTKVYRSDSLISTTFIGCANIPIKALIEMYPEELVDGFTETLPLSNKIPINTYGFKGIISVSVRYDPIPLAGQQGNLEVRIQQVSHLKRNGDKFVPLNSYVMCILLPDTNKKNRKISSIISKKSDPEYKFCCTFQNVTIDDLKHSRCLEVTVWTNKSKFIGGVRLCRNSTDSYNDIWQDSSEMEYLLWRQMLEKPKEWIHGSFPLRYTMISQNSYPILIEYVKNIWSEFISTLAFLSFSITYDTTANDTHSIVIYVDKVEGIDVGLLPIVCKIVPYFNGIACKSSTQCVVQSMQNTWQKSIYINLSVPIQQCAIELRIKTQRVDKYCSKTNLNNSIIFGRVMLSNGPSGNSLNIPTNEEKKLFNTLSSHPNTKQSVKMRLNSFKKSKNISRKSDKKRICEIKRGKSISIGQLSFKTKEPSELHEIKTSIIKTKNKHQSSISSSVLKNASLFDRNKSSSKHSDITNVISKLELQRTNSTSNIFAECSTVTPNSPDKGIINSIDAKFESSTNSTPNHDTCQSSETAYSLLYTDKVQIENTETIHLLSSDILHDSIISTSVQHVTENLSELIPTQPLPQSDTHETEIAETIYSPTPNISHDIVTSTPIYQVEKNLPHVDMSPLLHHPGLVQIEPETIPSSRSLIISSDVESPTETSTTQPLKEDMTENIASPIISIKPDEPSLSDSESKPIASIPLNSIEECNVLNTTGLISEMKEDSEKSVLHETINTISNEQTATCNETRNTAIHSTNETCLNFHNIETIEENINSNVILDTQQHPDIKTTVDKECNEEDIITKLIDLSNIEELVDTSIKKDTSNAKTREDSFEISSNSSIDQLETSGVLANENKSKEEERFGGIKKQNKIGNIFRRRSTAVGSNKKDNSLSSASMKIRPSIGSNTQGDEYKAHDDNVSINSTIFPGLKITGKILIGLKYLPIQNQLTITVKNAYDVVPHSHKSTKNDAYIKIEITSNNQTKPIKFKTKVIKSTDAPVWNESFTHTITPSDLNYRKIGFILYHRGFTKNFFLGRVNISMDEIMDTLNSQGYMENWYQLGEQTSLHDDPDSENMGDITLNISWGSSVSGVTKKGKKKKDTDVVLNVTIIDVKNVKNHNQITKAYCKVYLFTGKSDEAKKESNEMANISGNFNFNYTVNYDINSSTFSEQGLFIKLVDSKKSSLIGCIQLNNGSGHNSWQKATSQEITAWNSLINGNGNHTQIILPLKQLEIKK